MLRQRRSRVILVEDRELAPAATRSQECSDERNDVELATASLKDPAIYCLSQ
jgi:hypothetical protein